MANQDDPYVADPVVDEPEASAPKREPAFNIPASLLILIAVCLAVHIWQAQIASPIEVANAMLSYALIPARFVPLDVSLFDFSLLSTLITHTFLHGDWLHLGFNMVWLVAFGVPLAYRLGTVRTFAFWAATGVAAGAFHMALYWGDPVPLIGASGAVSGFLGAAARFGFRRPQFARTGFTQALLPPTLALRQRGVVPFLLLWMGLNFATGMGWLGGPSNIAWEAHVGGLLAGFLLIGLFDRPRSPQS